MAPYSPAPRFRAVFHSAAVMKLSESVSIQPKCSANSLSALNSCCDTLPSLSVSIFARTPSKAGKTGSLLPSVDTNSVSPLATAVPIAPLEPMGIHHCSAPVSSA